jgi:hypothetical protein
MNVIVLDTEAYIQLKLELKKYVKEALIEVLAEKNSAQNSDWIQLSEAKKLIPFKSKTSWQRLRDKGTIQFTQFGHMIMYSRTSILKYLDKNKIKF